MRVNYTLGDPSCATCEPIGNMGIQSDFGLRVDLCMAIQLTESKDIEPKFLQFAFVLSVDSIEEADIFEMEFFIPHIF